MAPMNSPDRDEAEKDSGDRFEKEQPLPASEAEQAVESENCAGEGRAERRRQRRGGHEQGNRRRTLPRREPVREIQDDAWEEASFGRAQQKAYDVEARRPLNLGLDGGQDSPGDHDSCDPQPRPESVEGDVRRFAERRDRGAGEHVGEL